MGKSRSKVKLKPTLEKPLQQAALQWFKIAGYYHKRIPIGGYPYRRKDGSIGMGTNPMKDFPDILFVFKNRPGKLGVVELKSTNGRLSDGQKRELAALEAAGVFVLVSRDLISMIDAVRRADVA